MAAQPSSSASVSFAPLAHPAQPLASTSGTLPKVSQMSTDSGVSVRKSRTLVLCFDGTANQYDGDNTNVVKFYSLLKKDETSQQLCYYQPGVGTYFQPGVVQPIFQWCAKIADEAVAWYLDAHVRGGYTFLMQNYRPGDKICIFGFSRGAYTARALAGMLHKIGLLPKDNPEQVPLAYKLYKSDDKNSRQLAAGFKQTFCRSVIIDFVGVWDTVASVGVLHSKTLPFTTTNTTIRTFRHALALDEHRAKFRPNLYHRLTPDASLTVPDVTAVQEDQMSLASPVSPTDDASPVSPTDDASFRDDEKKRRDGTAEDAAPPTPTPAAAPSPRKEKTLPPLPAKLPKLKFPPLKQWLGRRKTSAKTMHEKHVCRKHGDAIVNPANDPADDRVGQTDVLEVWFAGCHSDVGGGAVPNATANCLGDITLRWMVREVVQAQCGIAFDSDALKRADIPDSVFVGPGLPLTPPAAARARALAPHAGPPITVTTAPLTAEPAPLAPASPSTVNTHADHAHAEVLPGQKPLEAFGYGTPDGDARHLLRASEDSARTDLTDVDCVQPVHDELVLDRWWWLLEVVPTNYTWQDGRGRWHSKWGLHLGRGRHIPDICPKFHRSVRERMADAKLQYRPRAMWKAGTETYVE